MPSFEFTSPEGKTYTVEGPEGATKEQAFAMLQQQLAQKPESNGVMDAVKNAVGGFARSGMGVVSNLERVIDPITGGSNEERMARVNQRFQNQGYDPNSLAFKGGKFAGDVAVTAPVGGMLGKGVESVSQAPQALQLANALRTGGMASGAPLLTRMAAGGATGGAMAGITNPDEVGSGAALGAILPGGVAAGQLVG
ncbi:MAG TPA: hypothetical protein VIY48_20360, partial [Candidatus Paceibacterota bacterium]